MMNISDYNKNAQKAVSQGMETFFNWQKQALENTLTMVEAVSYTHLTLPTICSV